MDDANIIFPEIRKLCCCSFFIVSKYRFVSLLTSMFQGSNSSDFINSKIIVFQVISSLLVRIFVDFILHEFINWWRVFKRFGGRDCKDAKICHYSQRVTNRKIYIRVCVCLKVNKNGTTTIRRRQSSGS